MKLKDLKALLSRVPKGYEIEPMAIITNPVDRKVMLIPLDQPIKEEPKEEEKRKIGF